MKHNLAYILRHSGVVDSHGGWISVERLADYGFAEAEVFQTVTEDSKGRFELKECLDGHFYVRARYGHSKPADLNLGYTPLQPPAVLLHGTAEKYLSQILESGIEPRRRLFTHLSADEKTAIEVGKRHGKVVLLEIDSKQMAFDDFEFYQATPSTWLVKNVPPKYIINNEI